MDTFWFVLLCVAVIAAVVFAVLAHAGLLYSPIIRVSHPASMPRRSAYVLRTGPYKKTGKEFNRLVKLVPKDTTLFGVYYDDPEKVPESKLRWIVASFLPDEEGSVVEKRLISEGYKLYEFPQIEQAVTTDFPYRNIISSFLAVWIVYPLLRQFFERQKLTDKTGPCLEVYKDGLIHFFAPLEKKKEFYVPGVEVLESEEGAGDGSDEEKKDK